MGISTETLVCEDMTSYTDLARCHVLHSNSCYTVVASIFLVSAASCKAICRVASVRTSDYSQPEEVGHIICHHMAQYLTWCPVEAYF